MRALPEALISDVARVEVPAVIWRRQRAGAISQDAAAALADLFTWELAEPDAAGVALIPVAVTPAVLRLAAPLPERHALRAQDAVQLACAIAARRAVPALDRFACTDPHLRRAAAREGFLPLGGLGA